MKTWNRLQTLLATENRIINLWLAALAITWLSGLETMYSAISDRTSSLAALNVEKQRLNNEEQRLPFLNSEIDANERLLAELKAGAAKIQAIDRNISKEQEQPTPRPTAIENLQNQRRNLVHKLDRLADDEKRVKRSREVHQAQQKRLASAMSDASSRYKKVSKEKQDVENRQLQFELLGLKSDVPILVAPVLWSLLAVGLLLYVRHTEIQISDQFRQEIDALKSKGSAMPPVLLESPWWMLTANKVLAAKNYPSVGTLPVSAFLVFAMLALMECRVTWCALSLIDSVGTQLEQVIVVVSSLTAGAAFVWLAVSYLIEQPAGFWRAAWVRGITLALIVGLSVALYHIPAGPYVAASIGKSCVLAFALLLLSALVVEMFSRWILLKHNVIGIHGIDQSGRRKLLLALVGAVIVYGVFNGARSSGRLRHLSRKATKRLLPGREVALQDGLYRNVRGRVFYYVAGLRIHPSSARVPKRDNLIGVPSLSAINPEGAGHDGLFYSGEEKPGWPRSLTEVRPRISLATASNAFEALALSQLGDGLPTVKAYDAACAVLLMESSTICT